MPWPMAWNREEQAMPKPAKIKAQEMILRGAGTPISSMESEALKIIRRFSAARLNSSSPRDHNGNGVGDGQLQSLHDPVRSSGTEVIGNDGHSTVV